MGGLWSAGPGQGPPLTTFVEKRTASVLAQLAGERKGYVPAGKGFGPPGGGFPKGGPPGGFGPGRRDRHSLVGIETLNSVRSWRIQKDSPRDNQ